MVLLKHGDFEFHNILSGGYIITEDKPDVISEVKMADGSIKRNYGDVPKTNIKIKFGKLNKDTYKEYMSHFAKNEEVYSFFSIKNQEMKSKKFFVILPEVSVETIAKNHRYDEFQVELQQCGEA